MSNDNRNQTLDQHIKQCILSKWVGCFVALAAVLLTLIQLITYAFVEAQDKSISAIIFCVLAIVFFIVLSLFKPTSPLAPVALTLFDFLALLSFVEKIIDFFSTAFFSGFSIGAFFGLAPEYWLSTLLFVITFIVACVSVFLPQNRQLNKNNEGVKGNEVKEV